MALGACSEWITRLDMARSVTPPATDDNDKVVRVLPDGRSQDAEFPRLEIGPSIAKCRAVNSSRRGQAMPITDTQPVEEPSTLQVELTTSCNLACRVCPVSTANGPGVRMTEATLEKV